MYICVIFIDKRIGVNYIISGQIYWWRKPRVSGEDYRSPAIHRDKLNDRKLYCVHLVTDRNQIKKWPIILK